MIRKIIHIDEEKCNGCGLCANACHEGALAIIDGKARLIRDDYCDGMGDCLPACPMDALSFEERDALAYDEAAVMENMKAKHEVAGFPGAAVKAMPKHEAAVCPQSVVVPKSAGCPGAAVKAMTKQAPAPCLGAAPCTLAGTENNSGAQINIASELTNWPPQIKLAPLKAPYFEGADLLIAADCTAFTYGNFHGRFMKGRTTLIGCPKLDAVDYSEKLTEIFRRNDIKSILLVRMEVPCCGGMTFAVQKAIEASGKNIPLDVVTLSLEGKIL